MQPPPTSPPFSPDPNPPVKKLRAGGTPAASTAGGGGGGAGAQGGGGGPPAPPRGPPPPPSQGASSEAAASAFTRKVDDAMMTRRAELLKLRQKIQAPPGTGGAAVPGNGAAAAPGAAGSKPSTEDLLSRARAKLPPPQQPHRQKSSSGAPNPAAAQGRPAPSGPPPPPMMPVQDLNHFRRTSDIFPEVTSKADNPARAPPMPAVTPAPTAATTATTMMPPPMHSVTPAVPRNLDPSFANNVQSGEDPVQPFPPPAATTTTAAPASSSRSKSVPPPQRRPPPADAPPPPKSPGGASLGEPRRSSRPPPPGRPKAAPLEPLHPKPPDSGAPPTKGPPPQPRSVPRNESKPPPLAEEPSPGARKPAVLTPASAPASMSIPNGVDHLDKGSSHSHASDKSQPASGKLSVSLDDGSSTADPARRSAPPPSSHRGPGNNMPPPPVSPIKSNPALPPNKGVPPARVPSLMVDTRNGPDATNNNPFFPSEPGPSRITHPPPQQMGTGGSVVPDGDVYPPASSAMYEAERYLEASGTDLDAGLMEGAKTPPINNKSSVELRMQSELAQLQKDKAYALRRVIELEEMLHEQGQGPQGDAGPDASGLLRAILHLAETQGEGAALGWVQDQLAKNGAGAASNPVLGMAPLRHPPVLPRPKRGPSAADLPPEALRSAAERVEHEYVADCATFVVRRPYGLAEERELWFKTGQMPAKKYAEAASVSQVSTIEVAAVVRADESLLSVSGPHLVRHESNGQWHEFGDAPEKGEPLGYVSIVDGNTGEEIQYSLDEVYEGAVAVREQYCLSVLSSAAGIHAASKDGTQASEATKLEADKAEKDPAPPPAPQGDSAVTFGALFSFLWSGLLSLLFNIFVVFPLRVFSFTLAMLISVVLLSILWVYIAEEGQSAYWYNAPGIM